MEMKDFLNTTSEKRDILIVSHFDTDGITSAAIFGKCLKKLDKKFSFKIVKSLDKEFIEELPKTKVIVFLDLTKSHIENHHYRKTKHGTGSGNIAMFTDLGFGNNFFDDHEYHGTGGKAQSIREDRSKNYHCGRA